MALESRKKELLLSLDSFNKPAELLGKTAWSQLILNLLFLEQGTFPSVPDMGIGVQSYDFQFMDDAISILPSTIKKQVSIYLPDIPLVDVTASQTLAYGKPVLLLVLTFNDHGNIDTSAIASLVGTKIIDFDVTW